MLGFSRRSTLLVIATCGLKVIATTLVPFYSPRAWGGDFYAWVSGAQSVFITISAGNLPTIAGTGVYAGLLVVLAPFFWLWTIAPIPHPTLAEMAATSSNSEYLLVLIMKIPIILSDLLVGIVTSLMVQRATKSDMAAQKAFLAWYLNPFNAFWMYYFGGFDVVPTLVLLLAVLFGNKNQWVRSGFCLAGASLLRLFPVLLFPFFLIYSLRESSRSCLKLLTSFFVPIGVVFLSQLYVTNSVRTLVTSIVEVPLRQFWLLKYLGFSITAGLFLLAPFLLLVQLFLTSAFWRNHPTFSLVHFCMAPLLALFVGSYHNPYHFVWVSPFLSAYYALEKNGLLLYVWIFLSASLYSFGWDASQPLWIIQPLLAGTFFGFKAVYLVKLNFEGLKWRMLGMRRFYDLHFSA